MSFKQALKKLEESSEFQAFKKKNKKAFLFSAFFILNPEFEAEIQQFNYMIGKEKAMVLTINEKEGRIDMKTDKLEPHDTITEINPNIKLDIKDLTAIIKKETKSDASKVKISKIIAILQKIQGQQIWNLTCMLSNLQILTLHVDCFSAKVLESKSRSVFDIISIKK